MKLTTLFILFSLCAITSNAQHSWLTKKQVTEDLEFLSNTLDEKSSYAYLNGFDFNKDFENYLNIVEDSIRLVDFSLFLTNTLAKIGDRHSSLNRIRGYELNESLFLPFIYAPLNDKVTVLKKSEDLEVLNPAFPYLKKLTISPLSISYIKSAPKIYKLLKKPILHMQLGIFETLKKIIYFLTESYLPS